MLTCVVASGSWAAVTAVTPVSTAASTTATGSRSWGRSVHYSILLLGGSALLDNYLCRGLGLAIAVDVVAWM